MNERRPNPKWKGQLWLTRQILMLLTTSGALLISSLSTTWAAIHTQQRKDNASPSPSTLSNNPNPTVTTNPFQHGILFQPGMEVTLTHMSWNLVINFDLLTLGQFIKHVQDVHRNVSQKMVGPEFQFLQPTLKHMDTTIQEVAQEYAGILKTANPGMASQRRRKQNTASRIAHFFGLASYEDIRKSKEALMASLSEIDQIVTQSEYHTTVFKNVTGQLYQDQRQIGNLINITLILENMVAKVAESGNIKGAAYLLTAQGHLMDVVALIRKHLQDLEDTIDAMQRNRLDPSLFPVADMRKTLKHLETKLPANIRPVLLGKHIMDYCYRLPLTAQVWRPPQVFVRTHPVSKTTDKIFTPPKNSK